MVQAARALGWEATDLGMIRIIAQKDLSEQTGAGGGLEAGVP